MNVSNIIFTEKKLKIKNYKTILISYNQLFHPSSSINLESVNTILLDDVLGNSKFDKIIIKEAISLLSTKGNIFIYFSKNKFNYFLKTKDFIYNFVNHFEIVNSGDLNTDQRSEIISHIPHIKNKGFYIHLKKIKSIKYLHSKIYQWSFGIVSNGKNDSQVDKIIKSILNLKIPEFEILICGDYKSKYLKKIKLIKLNKFDDKGWITKKKNILVKNFKFENCCIVHDRIIFDKNWYKGMVKWGNNFEHLGCSQIFNNNRTNDWLINERYSDIYFGFASLLDYKDWSNNAFLGGQLHIFKKSLFIKRGWNNFLFWNEAEDYEISKFYNSQGYVLRLNPYSLVNSLSSRYNDIPIMKFSRFKRSNTYKGNILRILGRKVFKSLYRYSIFRNSLSLTLQNKSSLKIIKFIFKAL